MISQRVRDPIHDVITFDDTGLVDEVAWKLLQTRDMQRLRRVKQLGVSEFVFPGASHTRFAHSIGVFHTARRLVKVIEREIKRDRLGAFDADRARTALCAALLHDIGHGPFSHAFEVARKSLVGKERKIDKHEAFTAFMIEDPAGEISTVLKDARIDPHAVAELIRAETPKDMYHAVVSSSFDADRLDYLQRDRHMTGTGAGAIDIGWLMENVRVAEIDMAAAETDDEILGSTFCLDIKARDAAEDFLLARYRLFTNVYLHKTTRGIEQLVVAFFRHASMEINASGHIGGLKDDHPLVLFFSPGGETLENYRALDDTVVWGAIHAVATSGGGALKDMACRLRDRERPRCIDLQRLFPDDDNHQVSVKKAFRKMFAGTFGERVFQDVGTYSLYGEIGADDVHAQKRLMIRLANGQTKEITQVRNSIIKAWDRPPSFERYYFLDEEAYKDAMKLIDSAQGRHG